MTWDFHLSLDFDLTFDFDLMLDYELTLDFELKLDFGDFDLNFGKKYLEKSVQNFCKFFAKFLHLSWDLSQGS